MVNDVDTPRSTRLQLTGLIGQLPLAEGRWLTAVYRSRPELSGQDQRRVSFHYKLRISCYVLTHSRMQHRRS
jgi:hypothetical protein